MLLTIAKDTDVLLKGSTDARQPLRQPVLLQLLRGLKPVSNSSVLPKMILQSNEAGIGRLHDRMS